MLGAIAGDVIGSIYEWRPIKSKHFPLFDPRCRFTDDTVLSVAIAEAILSGRSYRSSLLTFGRRHPQAGFGGSFMRWLQSDAPGPYNSWGNGSAMRVAPVGFAFDTEEAVLEQARLTAEVSHNHPEGIKGAQATALSILLARQGLEKEQLRAIIGQRFSYDLKRSIKGIRPDYTFDVSCQGTVPEAIISFLDADSYEDAVRNAVSLGGDSDTLACITGGIAEAFYQGIPEAIEQEVLKRLTPDLLQIVEDFRRTYPKPRKTA
jgi:ADP-ribosylglycohydrolase